MSEESPSVYKLPLEVMGLVFSKLDQIEEIKKCRQISPRWYRAVQVLYQDQLFEKCLTHFDGRNHTYGQSRRFGLNVFGKFPVDFATFKISNSQYYLMERWLTNMDSNNLLQNLILQDNLLNLKELVEVLKHFPNIIKLEFVQSSEKMYTFGWKKMYELYANYTDVKSDAEIIQMIKSELEGTDNFLQNLKSIKFNIMHASLVNFVILIISCGQCELEEIHIKFNIKGIIASISQSQMYRFQLNYKNFGLGSMAHLNKFSKSFKKIKITAIAPSMSVVNHFGETSSVSNQSVFSRLTQSIFNIFLENQLKDLKNLEKLQITLWRNQFSHTESTAGLLEFIKSQNNLSKVEVGVISESFGSNQVQGQGQLSQGQGQDDLKKAFLASLNSLGVKFGYEVSKFGLDPITQYSENLVKLEVDLYPTSNWRLCDYHKSTFVNCTSFTLRNLCLWRENNNRWPNFEVPVIVKKFPNLKSFSIEDKNDWNFDPDLIGLRRPQISNNDLQNMIENWPNLEKLYLHQCIRELDDSGLTGLTSEALEIRKNLPNLPITAEERIGYPISHLKNLAELTIFKDYDTKIRRWSDPHSITDLTLIYGFKDQGSKFKSLSLYNTHITDTGLEVLKRKLPSNCQLISNPYLYFLY